MASSLAMTQSGFRLGSVGQIATAYTLRFEILCVMFCIHWMALFVMNVMTVMTVNLICSAMRSTRQLVILAAVLVACCGRIRPASGGRWTACFMMVAGAGFLFVVVEF